MKKLNKCKWQIQISEINLSGESMAQWDAKCLTMDGHRFANGGVGSMNCVRLFSSVDDAIDGWKEFAKLNGIEDFEITTPNE